MLAVIVVIVMVPIVAGGWQLLLPGMRDQPATQSPTPEQRIVLPGPRERGDVVLEEALTQRRSVRNFAASPLTLDMVGQLLWAAQGITAPWRGLRTAPSAGATFPLEVDVVVGEGAVVGVAAGVYRYVPAGHRLEARAAGDRREALAAAALGQPWVGDAPITIVISAVTARTTARYGERGHRYVFMEAGHAGQNVLLQAEALGLGSVPVGAFRDTQLAAILELPREEVPLYLLPVGQPAR